MYSCDKNYAQHFNLCKAVLRQPRYEGNLLHNNFGRNSFEWSHLLLPGSKLILRSI